MKRGLATAAKKDRQLQAQLQRADTELMKHRWVVIRQQGFTPGEYAAAVGCARTTIQASVTAYELLESGQARSPGEATALARIGAGRREHVMALAQETGRSVHSLVRNRVQAAPSTVSAELMVALKALRSATRKAISTADFYAVDELLCQLAEEADAYREQLEEPRRSRRLKAVA